MSGSNSERSKLPQESALSPGWSTALTETPPLRNWLVDRPESHGMVVADLHVHTTNSDGSLSIEQVPQAAAQASLDAVAITDHDRLHPALDAPVVDREGLTLIHGIELRVEAEPFRVDLLGYGVEPTADLEAELERLQRDRVQRAVAIIDAVESELGIDLSIEATPGIGRPHIARAVADHPETDYDVGAVFDDLIGDDGPCYVAREIPSFERGRNLLTDACSLVSLAHPFRYPDPATALDLTASLDAVERYYPYGRSVDESLLDDVIDEHGLLATGGSDAHDDQLGRAGLDSETYASVQQALGD
jgi:hypothetical protein